MQGEGGKQREAEEGDKREGEEVEGAGRGSQETEG